MTQGDKVKMVLEFMNSVVDAITAAGPHGIPSGHLYAVFMGAMTLDTFQTMIDTLVKAGKITNNGHLLRAVS
jgi:hypothetical protein